MKVARLYLRVSTDEQDISRLSLAETEQRVGSIRAKGELRLLHDPDDSDSRQPLNPVFRSTAPQTPLRGIEGGCSSRNGSNSYT
jgi:hypothetical protein